MQFQGSLVSLFGAQPSLQQLGGCLQTAEHPYVAGGPCIDYDTYMSTYFEPRLTAYMAATGKSRAEAIATIPMPHRAPGTILLI